MDMIFCRFENLKEQDVSFFTSTHMKREKPVFPLVIILYYFMELSLEDLKAQNATLRKKLKMQHVRNKKHVDNLMETLYPREVLIMRSAQTMSCNYV